MAAASVLLAYSDPVSLIFGEKNLFLSLFTCWVKKLFLSERDSF